MQDACCADEAADSRHMEFGCEGMNMKKRVLIVFAVMILCACCYLKGIIDEDARHASHSYARNALEKTGMSAEFAPGYCLHGFTGFRDTFHQVKFIVEDQHDRKALMAEMTSADGWHVSQVTAAEYLEFQKNCMWTYSQALSVPEEVVFDAWFYCETDEPAPWSKQMTAGALKEIGQVGNGYEFAVFDAETGMFIFADQFG